MATRTDLLAALGLHGLSHLDAPVLAALATESPMLLIGPHGSAKSALLERLAAALGLAHRHYNASLLSFDDLVGFPVPEGEGLRYLRTPATLWDAESVFLDEISRCRPEVQNKLFSIIHEKRVQGLALERLRYRW
ncbi:MAG: AAA family ATPase, partial [Gammaproteobacteria bacterium]